ncbi:hypothetical protein BH09MYX1_BH09MYX1_45690 [soil metagenome]
MARTKNPQLAELEAIATKLAKAKPDKAYALLHQAFLIFAAAGDAEHATAIVHLVYDGAIPKPTKLVHALGTGPMDGFADANGLPDLTLGEPRAHHLPAGRPLGERVAITAGLVRHRLTGDAYTQLPSPKAPFAELEGRELWRKAQMLAHPTTDDGATPKTEAEALQALTRYMDAWCNHPEERGAGYGQELVLACDLALRHGASADLDRWLAVLGDKLFAYASDALCLPAVARALAGGLLRDRAAISATEATDAFAAIESAARALGDGHAGAALDRGTIVREVSAEYSQFYLGHEERPDDEVFFQDPRESAQGMSLFASQVGIATPSETASCIVQLAVVAKPPRASPGPVQAVAFPFVVRGPLYVRSVSGGGDDEDRAIVIAHGTYDVLARFFPSPAPKEDEAAGLRVFRVTLDFLPAGTAGAPKCVTLEQGNPPKTIFSHA